ncbi:hypothetical protein GF351_06130, partial [Candidatus Woesearchaeota archaeon]|nr:hypothetical protein [Candidatus Woesearchaeota archaeon]
DIEDLTEFAQQEGAKGLAWIRLTEKGPEGTIVKFLGEDVIEEIKRQSGAKPGHIMFFIADKKSLCNDVIAKIRNKIADMQGLRKEDDFRFCWVVDFPMFAYNEEEDRWEPEHHLFTMPRDQDLEYLEKDPSRVHGKLYDLVLNGTEMCSGSIRINRKDIQQRVFDVIGLKQAEAEKKFGFLLRAFKYGAPPHGGVGIGFDRLCAMMQGINDIREVIAFPKNKAAECPMDGSPDVVDERQMKDLHLKCEVTARQREAVFEQIIDFLEKNKIRYELMEHKAVYTSEEAAKARGTELKQSAKTLICKTENKYLMAIVSGNKELDLEKLKVIAKVQSMSLASPDEVKDITGCAIGAVPPFGNLFSLDVFVDKEMMENKQIVFNAGSHTKSIKMFAGDYKILVKPLQADISK